MEILQESSKTMHRYSLSFNMMQLIEMKINFLRLSMKIDLTDKSF